MATRAPKLFPEEGELDWKLPASRLHDKIRAFHPAPGCWTTCEGARLKIWRTHAVEPPLDADFAKAPAGTVCKYAKGRAAIATGEGFLELIEVQPEGKKRLSGWDWFNGLRRADGISLGA